jgi:hypothetical protein
MGQQSERIWEAVFRASGRRYVALSRIEDGGAPMMKGKDGDHLILPDGLVSNCSATVYAEIKGKSHPVWWGLGSEWRHGVDRFNWEHYLAISQTQRLHCCLCIMEYYRDEDKKEWSGALLINTLAKLGPPCKGFSTQAHMIYWPRARFKILGWLSQENITRGRIPPFTDRLNEILDTGTEPPIDGVLF